MELGRFFGFMHPALVHFPLVLLLVSVALEIAGFLRRDARLAWAAQLTLIAGTVATLFAFVCGNFAEIWAARDGVPQEPMELHELYATVTSWLFVFLAAARLYFGKNASRNQMKAYLLFAIIGCVLLVITGHKGAMLVYEHGAGVQSGQPGGLPTHEDLAVLRQKQDLEALFYSDKMHHIFGVMVFILSLLLLIDMISPRVGKKLRNVTFVLLLAGGMYLMLFSDTDSWPLSKQRPITDKEVLMHKTYAVLMLFFGAQGLLQKKRTRPGGGAIAPTQGAAPENQDRAMAVFALVGGALLFTHVHSNAPYANVAVGVYIHHTVMGAIALSIGAVKLLQNSLRGRKARWPGRAVVWAYPLLMLTESVFLINYNEGLPWFLGYRGLVLQAPHDGLVAPLGRDRAEFKFDPSTSRMDIYLLRKTSAEPAPIHADRIQAITRVGTEPTVVTLDACPEKEGNYHFAGTASYLRGVTLFQVKLLTPQGHEPGKARAMTADFEPWTDSRAALLQHTRAAYVCPMHPAVGAQAPGRCAVCGMALVPNQPTRLWNKLHDDAFQMELTLEHPASVVPLARPLNVSFSDRAPVGKTKDTGRSAGSFVPVKFPQPDVLTRLRFTPRRADGTTVRDLAVVHTKKLHLIMVSRDLSYFDHVHPTPQPDGSLLLDYTFPHGGDYILYADLTPVGDRNQVFFLPVTVAGAARAAEPLVPTPAPARSFGSYRVRLDLSPSPAQPGEESQLTFTLYEDGKPVTDLEPYLGAGGHCVAISNDTQNYLHSHPAEMNGKRFGPAVTFHTLFPRPGLYKIWGQFRHHGKPVIADFVISVPKK